MSKFIVWADGRKDEAVAISADSTPEAIDIAADRFDVGHDKINTIEAERMGEAEYYGVAHLAAISEGDRVEAGSGEDHDTGRIERIEGSMAYVAWDSGVKTPCPVSDLRLV